MTHFLTLEDVQDICYEYAKAHLSHDEPIPSFDTRFPGKLESVLDAPKRGNIEGEFANTNYSQQSAVLFYEMIKQHPFLNGNKRIACVSLMTFLSLNNLWLHTSWKRLYDIAVNVAVSETKHREGMLSLLREFIYNNISERNNV